MLFAATHVLALCGLTALFYLTGRMVSARVPAIAGGPIRQVAFGLAIWMYLLFAAASLQLYRPVFLGGLVGAVFAVAAIDFWRTRGRVKGQPLEGLGLAWVALVPAGAAFVAILLTALKAHVDWDDSTYHLTVPKQYLLHGGFRRLPFSIFSNWPLNLELVYGLSLALYDYVLAKLTHSLTFLLLLLQCVRMVRRYSATPAVAPLTALCLLPCAAILHEAPNANVDIGLALFFALALELSFEHLESGDWRPLAAAGAMCGVMAGIKLTGTFGAVAIGVVILGTYAVRVIARQKAKALSSSQWRWAAVAFGAPAFLLALPWYVKTALLTGNPFYPLLFRWFGGPEWSERLGVTFTTWMASFGMGRTPRDFALLPIRVIFESGVSYQQFDFAIGKHWVVALGVGLLGCAWSTWTRRCMAAAGVYFVLWSLASQQTRFLIPVLAVLSIAAAIAIGDLLALAARRGAARSAAALGLLAAACAVFVFDRWPTFRGLQLPEAEVDLAAPTPGAYRFLNTQTPPTARVMMMNTNQGFFLERGYIADSAFEASQLAETFAPAKSEEDVLRILEGYGITHILYDGREWGTPFSPHLRSLLARLPAVHRSGNQTVYDVPAR